MNQGCILSHSILALCLHLHLNLGTGLPCNVGWCYAGPRTVRCMSLYDMIKVPDMQILEMETLPGKVRALLKEINELYGQ